MNVQEQHEFEEGIKAENRIQIHQHMMDKEQQKHCHYEDMRIEKKMMDDIMRSNYDEDVRELKEKKCQKVRERDEMDKAAVTQIAWKENQKQMLVREDEEIERQVMEKMSWNQSFSDEKERRGKEKEDSVDRMAVKFLAQESERHGREDFITDKQQQEFVEKSHQYDIDEMENEMRHKRQNKETQVAQVGQIKMKAKLAREAKEWDVQIRKASEETFREEEVQEREKEREKHEKDVQYSQDLLKQIEGNKKKRESDKRDEQHRDQLCDSKWSGQEVDRGLPVDREGNLSSPQELSRLRRKSRQTEIFSSVFTRTTKTV